MATTGGIVRSVHSDRESLGQEIVFDAAVQIALDGDGHPVRGFGTCVPLMNPTSRDFDPCIVSKSVTVKEENVWIKLPVCY